MRRMRLFVTPLGLRSVRQSIMLTREHIRSGEFLRSYRDLPGGLCWSESKVAASLADTLAQRKSARDIHVFGYGSLIWNPAFHFAERRVATLAGWHRSFCQRLIGGRGSADTPGRMLSLEPGGYVSGIAFSIPTAIADEELRILWTREMLTGAYQPRWLDLCLDDGRQTPAITFVTDTSHPLYEKDSTVTTVAKALASARGKAGPTWNISFGCMPRFSSTG